MELFWKLRDVAVVTFQSVVIWRIWMEVFRKKRNELAPFTYMNASVPLNNHEGKEKHK